MAIGSFSDLAGGSTSDHTYQSFTITSYPEVGAPVALTGMTWNLLNRCHEKNDRQESNNPFNLEENAAEYVARKIEQLEFLEAQIKSGTLDFIVLQEVDIFTQDPLPVFLITFLKSIREQGWKTVHTERSDNVRSPLLTFYNSKKLEPIGTTALFPADNGKNCGLEATFKHKDSDTEVCITNIDLDHNKDFRSEILEYQKEQIKKDKFTIIAGDANHPEGLEHYSLIGDLTEPTNIPSAEYGYESPDNMGSIDTPMPAPIRVDGIMVSPVSRGRIEVTQAIPSAYFEVQGKGLLKKALTYVVNLSQNQRVVASDPNCPWIATSFKHLLLVGTNPPNAKTKGFR